MVLDLISQLRENYDCRTAYEPDQKNNELLGQLRTHSLKMPSASRITLSILIMVVKHYN